MSETPDQASPRSPRARWAGAAGSAAAALAAAALAPEGLRGVLALLAGVAGLWLTRALPLPVTALVVPLAAVVGGLATPAQAFAPFANPVIFLFLGGFALAAALLLPVLLPLAATLGLPAAGTAAAVALAASCAFMLPVATPPNALVYATGQVPAGQMLRMGLWLNVLAIVLLTALAGWAWA